MNKASLRTIVLYALQYFGTIALLLCFSFFVRSSGELSAIFIGAAYVYYGAVQALRVRGKASISIVIVGAVVLGLGLLTYFVVIGGETIDGIIGFLMKCVSGVLLLIIVVMQPMLNQSKRYSIKRRIRDLVYFAYALIVILMIGGTALSMFVQPILEELDYRFQFYILSIVGCAIWVAVTVYSVYLMATHEYDDTVLKAEAAIFGFVNQSRNAREYGEIPESTVKKYDNPLSLTELEKITKKIADSWTGTSDILSASSGVAQVKYSVTVQISGWDTIRYRIDGKLSGIDGKNADRANMELRSKLNALANQIKERTRRELEQKELLRNYEIYVDIGNFT